MPRPKKPRIQFSNKDSLTVLSVLRSACIAVLPLGFFLLQSTQAQAEEINTLAANANCDIVSIRQAKRQAEQDETKVDWYEFDKKHREYTGKELLPEHHQKEPERDLVIGCGIRNEVSGEEKPDTGPSGVELELMEVDGWARTAGEIGGEEEEDREGAKHPQEKSDEPKKSILDILINESPLVLQVAAILCLTAVAIAVVFGLRLLGKIAFGLLQRRRVCMVPCSLVAPGREIVGHMSVIGLRSFRFVPESNDEMEYFRRTLDEPTMHFFTAEVGDMSFDVFVDGIRGYYSPVAFDEKLTAKRQKEILAYSTVTPQIGQLIVVPYDVKRHKKHKANRPKTATLTGDMTMAQA